MTFNFKELRMRARPLVRIRIEHGGDRNRTEERTLGWSRSRLVLGASAVRVRGAVVLVVQPIHAGEERKKSQAEPSRGRQRRELPGSASSTHPLGRDDDVSSSTRPML
jgi:hypothetical protein